MRTFCKGLLLISLISVCTLTVTASTFLGDSLNHSNDTLLSRVSNKRNIVTLNLFDLVFTDLTFNYERLVGKKSKIGLKLGLTYGFNTRSKMEYDFENLFNSNSGFNYYPVRHKKWKYFTGLTIKTGIAEYSDYTSLWKVYPEYYYISDTYYYTKFFIDNGFQLSTPNGFYFAASLGLGMAFYDYSQVENINYALNLSMNMGIRF